MNISKIIISLIFIASLLFNLLCIIDYSNLPTYQLGVLKQDLNITGFSQGNIRFKLPKGMIVMDNSPRNIATAGLFSPERITFSIIIDRDFVDYSQSNHQENRDALYESTKLTESIQ